MLNENSVPATTSQTQTETHPALAHPILHLRSQDSAGDTKSKKKSKSKPKVKWEQDVIDNENMGKKKSKICCIFHPHREFGEASDDSNSDTSSDESDGEGNALPRNNDSNHHHCSHDHDHDHKSPNTLKRGRPNAYETQPKYENQSKLPENRD